MPMPGLLLLGRFGSVLAGGIFLVLLLLAPWDIGSYSINNEPVSGPEFLRRGGVAWGVVTIDLLATAYALWTEQWWSRWTMLAYWVIVAVTTWTLRENTMDGVAGVLSFLVFGCGPAVWYLFAKENVVRYFEMLERRADRAAAGTTEESA